ncbi:4-hydroxyphenylpyruvate dioxygenase [Aphelenchoides fujianensis]|nr:4-hydroxyphenylpyruvate dioxygenase [Aphelenchoides fujianensis]
MKALIEQLGFVAASRHPTKAATRYKQGRINLIVNEEQAGQVADFRAEHGPSANGMAFRVENADQAYADAIKRGRQAGRRQPLAAGRGRQGAGRHRRVPGAALAEAKNNVGLDLLDHLTHNVRRGQMRTWSTFYNQVFGFEEQKYFDIKGQATGLSQDDKSQIEEFIRQYNGEGIQHLALTTDNIYETVEKLRARGVKLQDTIETYYELVDKRVPGHGEDLERLRKNRILIDGNVGEEGLLLQIFTENLFGPIFFEIIQRKGNQGFGNGNFQALFESIELDQIRRGVITVEA